MSESNNTCRRSIYKNKADIYSLGIILFEMLCGKFDTQSERIHHLCQLREPDLLIDEEARHRLTDRHLKLLRKLLQHDPKKRPSCQELLDSDLAQHM